MDLVSNVGGESNAGALNLAIGGKNGLFDSISDILNPLEIPCYGIPGDIKFSGNSSLRSIEIIEFYNASDIAH